MSYWVAKALIQGIISKLPSSYYRDFFFHKYMRKSLILNDAKFTLKLKECRRHLESYFLFKVCNERRLFSIFELGTGWFPILPVAFYLCGASKIFTIDRTNLITDKRVKKVLDFFIDYADRGDLITILPWVRMDRVSKMRKLQENADPSCANTILEKLNIYFIVCDSQDTGLTASSIDFFVSNTTLEYIPENILKNIFAEFQRLASPKALMSHLIITSDHYADIDHCITPFNFMKYPAWLWRLFNNNWHYQNRLRASDYCKMHEAAGFEILQKYDDLGPITDLERIRLSKDFDDYSKDDLLVIRTRIVSTFREAGARRQI